MSSHREIVERRLAQAEAEAKCRDEEAIQDLPKPLSLHNYAERMKHIKLDKWQVNLCERLEKAFWLSQADKFVDEILSIDYRPARPYRVMPSGLIISEHEFRRGRNHATRAAIHAPPQFGKSILISQCYPAWILGFDPLHRFRLATYNIFHSARFSVVVKNLIRSPEHRAMFPDKEGCLPAQTKAVEWSTLARLGLNDGQASFTALGLLSGFVGTGADTLLIDDPYKSAEEALSDVIRDKTWRFWTDTASPRMNEHSNVFIMFHRYHQDDMGGRAIGGGDFDLWRYAAQSDGEYEDEESGLKFADPMGRDDGEYLSPRFGELYYLRQKKNEQVWYSQFQGRPSAKTGNMFNVGLLQTILPSELPEMLFRVRAWDNAATQGGGAFTAGVLMGIDAAENIYIFDVVREQVGTAEREKLQQATAEKDGKMVHIHAPEDPGSAGKDVALEFEQHFSKQGYSVTTDKAGSADDASGKRVYGHSKVMRAYPFSKATNSSKVFVVRKPDGEMPDWFRAFKTELQHFPASTYKDQVDAASDAHSFLKKLFYRGLVIKGASHDNLLRRSLFEMRFGEKVPAHWEVEAAVRLAPDGSKPSGFAIVARAAENAYLGELVFVVAAERFYAHNPIEVFNALQAALARTCSRGAQHPLVIWISRGANEIFQVASQKLNIHVVEFLDDEKAGIPETNFYFQNIPVRSPFYDRIGTSRCLCLVDDDQISDKGIKDERGLLSLRQELATWSYTDHGEVQPFGGITLDCVRMTLHQFALSATQLTPAEKRLAKLAPEHRPEAIKKLLGTPQFPEALLAQERALYLIRTLEEKEKRNGDGLHIGPRAVVRRYRKR